MEEKIPITIIGGGVVGCAVAYELSKKQSGDNIVVIDKNSKIPGNNQSTRNAGIIHSGVSYTKEKTPLKALLCPEGVKLVYEFCKKYEIPHKKTGKLVLATESSDYASLESLLKASKNCGVPAEIISREDVKVMEPNIECLQALHIPSSGIFDSVKYYSTLRNLAAANGVTFVTGTEVTNIDSKLNCFNITTHTIGQEKEEKFNTDLLINAAGLYSDEIANLVNPENHYEIELRRSETVKFYKNKRPCINMNGMLVFSKPPEDMYHSLTAFRLCPTFGRDSEIAETVNLGPLFSPIKKKEDYKTDLRLEKEYLESTLRFFPYLRIEDLTLDNIAMSAKLKNCVDFMIKKDEKYSNCLHLLGINAPGVTSSLSIAKYVNNLIG